jgi:hypothetical protein
MKGSPDRTSDGRIGPPRLGSEFAYNWGSDMVKILQTLFVGAAMGLCSCGNNEPKCSSPDTIATLQNIFEKNGIKAALATGSGGGSGDISVVNIVTVDQKPNKASCKAALHIVLTLPSGEKKPFPNEQNFTYIAERTDDGKLLVTAYGL